MSSCYILVFLSVAGTVSLTSCIQPSYHYKRHKRVHKSSECSCLFVQDCENMDDDYAEDWKLPISVLVLIASASFYFQAIVTEERFVPALNVISKRLKMSDDVAGATLMAAGASSPELFAAMISVFVTHSALGIGTVVGSEVRVLQMLVDYNLDGSWTCH